MTALAAPAVTPCPVMTTVPAAPIWTRPADGWEGIGSPLASCADRLCQQPRPVGRPPRGWVAVRRTDSATVWCCSYRCASIVCLRSELATGDTGPSS